MNKLNNELHNVYYDFFSTKKRCKSRIEATRYNCMINLSLLPMEFKLYFV